MRTAMPMPMPGGVVPIGWASANLGPLVRWTSRTRGRTAITSHGQIAAILISPQELAALELRRLEEDLDETVGFG